MSIGLGPRGREMRKQGVSPPVREEIGSHKVPRDDTIISSVSRAHQVRTRQTPQLAE